MTANEIIYDVREKLKLSTDDIDISDEYIFHLINVKRALLTKQRYAKSSREIPEEMKQVICISMELTNDIEGVCGEKILASTIKLPASIEIGGRSALINIRVPKISSHFINIIPMERFSSVGYNKFLKNMTYVAQDADNKLYVKSPGQDFIPNTLKVSGIFSNPEDANKLACDNEQAECDYYDQPYPIEAYIVSDAVNMIVKELAPGLKLAEDNLNNSDESNR